MERFSNDHEDRPSQHENSRKLSYEARYPVVNLIESQWKLKQQYDKIRLLVVTEKSVSLLSVGTVQPESTYSCILKVTGQVWEIQKLIRINTNHSYHQHSSP